MSATVIYERNTSDAAGAFADGEELWLSPEALLASTGWELKPQGLCLDERCVPIPPARANEFVDASNRVNLAAFARYLGQPVVHDDVTGVWVFGESAATRQSALQTLRAPDFTLPDIDGTLHSLTEYRGKKVLLFAWASW